MISQGLESYCCDTLLSGYPLLNLAFPSRIKSLAGTPMDEMAVKIEPIHLDVQEKGALANSASASPLKRRNQVKVLLNEQELAQLDWIVLQMGSDRASVFRYLLSALKSKSDLSNSSEVDLNNNDLSCVKISQLGSLGQRVKSSIRIFTPRAFNDIPIAIDMLRNGHCVVINLTMMTPTEAQRSVDFMAGGAFFGAGHQERIAESVFLFASKEFDVSDLENKKTTNAMDPKVINESGGILNASLQSIEFSQDTCISPNGNDELPSSVVSESS